jgi:hypothetical protein
VRLLLFIALVLACAPFARAAPSLPSALFGLSLETSLDAAQNKLPTYKVGRDPSDPAKTHMTGGPAELYGEAFTVNFSFDAAKRLSAIYAVARTPTDDPALCRQTWANIAAGIAREFGEPTARSDERAAPIQSQIVNYRFEGGETLEASLSGCLIMVSFAKAR